MVVSSLEEKLWSRVNKSPGCWLWTARSKTTSGYGKIKHDGVTMMAHRVSWELVNGPVPTGLCVLHDCPGGDNPLCVNPAHLWLGTQSENTKDRHRKQRDARGERQWKAKLTDIDIIAIRSARSAGETTVSLAKRFGVAQPNISDICLRYTWRHVA